MRCTPPASRRPFSSYAKRRRNGRFSHSRRACEWRTTPRAQRTHWRGASPFRKARDAERKKDFSRGWRVGPANARRGHAWMVSRPRGARSAAEESTQWREERDPGELWPGGARAGARREERDVPGAVVGGCEGEGRGMWKRQGASWGRGERARGRQRGSKVGPGASETAQRLASRRGAPSHQHRAAATRERSRTLPARGQSRTPREPSTGRRPREPSTGRRPREPSTFPPPGAGGGSGEYSHSCGCVVGCGNLAPSGLVGSPLPQRVLLCGAPMSRAFALGSDPLGGPASCA